MVGVERKEIVSLFFKLGVLLRHEELDWLNSVSDAEVNEISRAVSPKDEIARRMAAPKFEVLKNLTSKPAATVEMQPQFFNSRYEQMKAITSQRIARNWRSINNLPSRGEVFLTGIVRNIREGEKTVVEMEDPTGSIAVTFAEKPDVQLDGFAAVRAAIAWKAVFGKEVLHPDIPIRAATKGDGRACFISDLHLEEAPLPDARRLLSSIAAENVDWLFVAGDTGRIEAFEDIVGNIPMFIIPGEADAQDAYPQLPMRTNKTNIIPLSNPSVVRVGGLNVLLCHKFEQEMLRRRHLGSSEVVLANDFLVLDCVPDIVGYGHDHKPLVSNYKATTLVNAGSLLTKAQPVIIDFKTREWKQLKFEA